MVVPELSSGFHKSLLDLLLKWYLVICGEDCCWLSDTIAGAKDLMLILEILGAIFCR